MKFLQVKLTQSEEVDFMYGFIYETTNLINGKKYIGKRVYTKGWENYLGSGVLLKLAIEKYGKENFKRIILKECPDSATLEQEEKYYISLYNAVSNPAYYNLAEGGAGGRTTGDGKEHPKSNKRLACAYSIRDNIIYEFYTQSYAQSVIGVNQRIISDCLNKKQFSANDYIFYYKDEGMPEIPTRLKMKIASFKGETIEFISNAELSRKIGVNPSTIGNIVRGKTKQSKDGLTIKFKDNPEPSIVKLQ